MYNNGWNGELYLLQVFLYFSTAELRREFESCAGGTYISESFLGGREVSLSPHDCAWLSNNKITFHLFLVENIKIHYLGLKFL